MESAIITESLPAQGVSVVGVAASGMRESINYDAVEKRTRVFQTEKSGCASEKVLKKLDELVQTSAKRNVKVYVPR